MHEVLWNDILVEVSLLARLETRVRLLLVVVQAVLPERAAMSLLLLLRMIDNSLLVLLVCVLLKRHVEIFLEEIFSVVVKPDRELECIVQKIADQFLLQLVGLCKPKHCDEVIQLHLVTLMLLELGRQLVREVLLEVSHTELLVVVEDATTRL